MNAIGAITQTFATPAMRAALPQVTEKVAAWVSRHFGIIQNGFFLAYGGKELVFDGLLPKRQIEPLDEGATWVQKMIHKVKNVMANLFQLHGGLYIGSALAGTAVEMHNLGWINLGVATTGISFLGNGLFLYASLLSLGFHVDLYNQAKEIEENGWEKPLVTSMKASAIMGIINSIGYVLAAILTISGAGVAIALVFGCLALATGCIKVLYDHFVLSKKLALNHL